MDASTVTLGNDDGNDTPVATYANGSLIAKVMDFNDDGLMDLGLTFSPAEMEANGDLSISTTNLVLNGETTDGQAISGNYDVVVTDD